VLIPTFGVWTSQLLAAGVNVGIGCAAIALSARFPGGRMAARTAEAGAAIADDAPPPLSPAERLGARLAYAGAAVSGLCALALEVLWTRAVSIAVGTTTYSFTVMLVSFLTGIWLGSWLHAAVRIRNLVIHVQLGVVLLVIGAASVGASLLIPRLPDLVVQLNVWLYGVETRILPGATLLGGFIVMLLPCIFMGIAFPLSGKARARLGAGFGRSTGDTFGWNTLGSVLGSLLAGFVLIPSLGLQRGMLLAAGLYMAYGCFVLAAPLVLAAETKRRFRVPAVASACVVAAAALSLPVWMSAWDVRNLGSFQNNQLNRYVSDSGDVNVRARLDEAVVLHYGEGRVSTVSVVDMAGDWALLVNGKAVAADGPNDIRIQLMLGHVPLLMHPGPTKALVVGMGTGYTLGSVTAHGSLDQVTLVEIEPAILEARPFFASVNGDPLADPRLEVEIQDGRNYLKTTSQRFDVITADPIHPWNAGSGYLFTREYYTTVREVLEPQGIMCQWLPIYGLSIENYKSIVSTFGSVFPETMLWQIGYDTLLIGSAEPFSVDFAELERRLQELTVRAQLEEIGLTDPHAFMAELGLDPGASADYAQGGIVNTDDNLYLEFAAPFSIGTGEIAENSHLINSYRARPYLDGRFLQAPEAEREILDRHRRAKRATVRVRFSGAAARRKAQDFRQILEALPGYRPAELQLSKTLVAIALEELKARRLRPALQAAEEARALDPRSAAAHRVLGLALVRVQRHDDAIAHLERSLSLRPGRWRALAHLSRAFEGAGRPQEAEEALRAAIAINPHNPRLAARLERL
jgi:spermidine synthase